MGNLLPPKSITSWYPLGGNGYILQQGTCFLVDNSGNFLVDNLGNFLVTTSNVQVPKNVTVWTPSAA